MYWFASVTRKKEESVRPVRSTVGINTHDIRALRTARSS
jgi:hypothetical protein